MLEMMNRTRAKQARDSDRYVLVGSTMRKVSPWLCDLPFR
jgi:hypothetical protein